MTGPKKVHWDSVYGSKPLTEVSWYEPRPVLSLQFIRASRLQSNEAIIDVGGGGSFLAEELLGAGYEDLTVLDISSEVLKRLGERLGERARQVTLLQQDVTDFRPARRYALWHDRAVFHFLIRPEERNGYLCALREALQPGGQVVIGTFGLEGPQQCSGLPVIRYDAMALAAELGSEFELVQSSHDLHRTPAGRTQQFLYCRFHRHACQAGVENR